jgi:undecaprenyl phosphate N,N'-diacetylbacillosamine 1-phosphate transferase
MYANFVKRILDFMAAAVLLAVLSWLFLILAALIAARLGRPVVFRQERPGRIDRGTGQERIFTLYKFRTMTDARYGAEDERAGRGVCGELLPDEERLTPFGRKLRSMSLDELPELVNILRGDMSFVGPRPLFVSYLDHYTQEERHRHDVRPGLTGLAQVNGRNAIDWKDRFRYDLQYVNEISFALDFNILCNTLPMVIHRENIEATITAFEGTANQTSDSDPDDSSI